jgi:phosphatidylglycerophosphate synthase
MASSRGKPRGDRISPLTHFDDWMVQTLFSSHLHFFCRWRIHPNILTALSLGFSAAIPFLHLGRRTWAVIAAIIFRQLLDCLDGEVARQCKKTSILGAWLDLISDSFFFWGLILIVISAFIRSDVRIIVWSCLIYGVLLTLHVAICGGRLIIDHGLKDYNAPSIYRKCFAFLTNDSLLFVAALAVVYGLAAR